MHRGKCLANGHRARRHHAGGRYHGADALYSPILIEPGVLRIRRRRLAIDRGRQHLDLAGQLSRDLHDFSALLTFCFITLLEFWRPKVTLDELRKGDVLGGEPILGVSVSHQGGRGRKKVEPTSTPAEPPAG
jgi:hypothetical protein